MAPDDEEEPRAEVHHDVEEKRAARVGVGELRGQVLVDEREHAEEDRAQGGWDP